MTPDMFKKTRSTNQPPPVQGCCAWPGCTEDGRYPAPRDPRNLSARQYFCQPHIKEFNSKWNGLKGFSENEIFGMQNGAATVGRPTWGMGVNASGANGGRVHVETLFGTAQDLYQFFQQRMESEKKGALPTTATLPPDVKEACAIFSLPQPLPAPQLKARYLTLVKQHHPDVNKAEDAAEHIKRINVAYRILTTYAQATPSRSH